MFFCEISKILKNTFFYKRPPVAASGLSNRSRFVVQAIASLSNRKIIFVEEFQEMHALLEELQEMYALLIYQFYKKAKE